MSNLEVAYDCLGLPTRNVLDGRRKQIDGCLIDLNGELISSAVHKKPVANPHWQFQIGQAYSDPEIIFNDCAYYGGVFYSNHFGHFLLESLSRLWFYNSIKDSGYKIFFYRVSLERENNLASWIIEILSLLNISDSDILFIDKNICFKEIIIPRQLPMLRLSPELSSMSSVIKANISQHQSPVEANKIYISRSNFNILKGRFAGESVLEQILEEQGFLIFHPQEYSVKDQLSLYLQAETLIFAEGSAAHLCILLASIDANVIIINRRAGYKTFLNQFNDFNVTCHSVDSVSEKYVQKDLQFSNANALSILNFDETIASLTESDVLKSDINYGVYRKDWENAVADDIATFLKEISHDDFYSPQKGTEEYGVKRQTIKRTSKLKALYNLRRKLKGMIPSV